MKLLSKSIFKQSVKNNWKLWLILTAVLCFMISMSIIAVTSRVGDRMGHFSMEESFGPTIFGATGIGTIVLFIYMMATGNKLVASEIDRGTMSFTLNTPTTRKQIIFTKVLFYIGSFLAMIVLFGLFATVVSLATKATIDVGTFWLIILGCALFCFATSGICFAASCWFNRSEFSLTVGIGLPALFLLLSKFSAILTVKGKEFLKYISLDTLFDTDKILAHSSGFIIPTFIVMFVIGAVLYAFGITTFLKKDLPL